MYCRRHQHVYDGVCQACAASSKRSQEVSKAEAYQRHATPKPILAPSADLKQSERDGMDSMAGDLR